MLFFFSLFYSIFWSKSIPKSVTIRIKKGEGANWRGALNRKNTVIDELIKAHITNRRALINGGLLAENNPQLPF